MKFQQFFLDEINKLSILSTKICWWR